MGYVGSIYGVLWGILRVLWVILYMLEVLWHIAFANIFVKIWSTMGYFESTTRYVGSTLECIWSALVHSEIT